MALRLCVRMKTKIRTFIERVSDESSKTSGPQVLQDEVRRGMLFTGSCVVAETLIMVSSNAVLQIAIWTAVMFVKPFNKH